MNLRPAALAAVEFFRAVSREDWTGALDLSQRSWVQAVRDSVFRVSVSAESADERAVLVAGGMDPQDALLRTTAPTSMDPVSALRDAFEEVHVSTVRESGPVRRVRIRKDAPASLCMVDVPLVLTTPQGEMRVVARVIREDANGSPAARGAGRWGVNPRSALRPSGR